MPSADEQQRLARLDKWIAQLESQAEMLLTQAAGRFEEMTPAEMITGAGKLLALMAKLIELREQYATADGGQDAAQRLIEELLGIRPQQAGPPMLPPG